MTGKRAEKSTDQKKRGRLAPPSS